jgi:hypothetical protein
MLLTSDNYQKGFLVDEELIGGITEDPSCPGSFVAYVLNHLTGEYLGYQPHPELETALQAINAVQRAWHYESVSGCGNGNCKVGADQCKGTGCKGFRPAGRDAAPCSTGEC